MGIAASIVSVILKSVAEDKLGSGLINELAGISIDGVSEKGINKITDFINGEKSKIDSILSKENMKSMGIPEDTIDYAVTEIKALIVKIDITDEVLRQCQYNSTKLKDFMWNEYVVRKNRSGYIECESEIKTCLFAVAEALNKVMRESENFSDKMLIQISNAVDDTNVGLQKLSEYMDSNFGKLSVDNQAILEILKMILKQNQGDSAKNKEKRHPVKSRTQEYADKWEANMFLNNFDKRDKKSGVNVKLREVYLDEHLPHYIWGDNDENEPSTDLKELLSEYINEKSNNKMLLVLGQPGIGKSTLITWIIGNFALRKDDILVYQFASDLKSIDWNCTIENYMYWDEILNVLDLTYDELDGKILIFDGFDEISVRINRIDILNKLLSREVKSMHSKFSLIITCRENCIYGLNRIKYNYITLKPWDIGQIESFCKIYCDKVKCTISENTMNNIFKNWEILGIPLILYMVLALNISIEKEGLIVDIYDRVFSLEGGIYDRCIGYAEPHRIKRIKDQIHEISKRIALWMFENNPERVSISQNEYKKICDNVMKEQSKDDNGIEQDVKIGNYFKSVKYCEGVETEELYFVHRSIYEYFVAEMIYMSICEQLDTSKEALASIFGKLLKNGKLSRNMLDYLKQKIVKSKLKNSFAVVNEAFQLMLQDGMIYHTGECYNNMITCEMNVFANMLELIHLWDEGCSLRIDDSFCRYLKYNKYVGLNLEKMILRLGKDESKNRMLDLSKPVNLPGVNLKEANLRCANFKGANLCRADLRYAKLNNANFSKVNFSGADLVGVDFGGANLEYANFERADLRNCLFQQFLIESEDSIRYSHEANLTKVNLTGAIIDSLQIRFLEELSLDVKSVRVYVKETKKNMSYQEYCENKLNIDRA